MTAVKVCGIRSLAEAQWAVTAGAAALGFIFAPGSKRYMVPEQVRAITACLPPFVARIGVFVDQPPDEVARVAKVAGLTGLQLHGNEDPAAYAGIGLPIIKALRVDAKTSAVQAAAAEDNNAHGSIHNPLVDRQSNHKPLTTNIVIRRWQGTVQGILIDSVHQGQFGGTGRAISWESKKVQALATDIRKAGFTLVLAGGLTAQNVAAGMAALLPAAVDVNSGVEKDGRKDRNLIEDFFRAVQAAQV